MRSPEWLACDVRRPVRGEGGTLTTRRSGRELCERVTLGVARDTFDCFRPLYFTFRNYRSELRDVSQTGLTQWFASARSSCVASVTPTPPARWSGHGGVAGHFVGYIEFAWRGKTISTY